jgi:hypothetical protein
MSEKYWKKVRRMYRKDLTRLAIAEREAIMKTVRPKPKWIPGFMWWRIVKIFFKI